MEALINAKYEIKKVTEQDGYLVDITESYHSVQGHSIHFRFEQMVGSYFQKIAEVCQKYDLSFYVTGKGTNAILTIN